METNYKLITPETRNYDNYQLPPIKSTTNNVTAKRFPPRWESHHNCRSLLHNAPPTYCPSTTLLSEVPTPPPSLKRKDMFSRPQLPGEATLNRLLISTRVVWYVCGTSPWWAADGTLFNWFQRLVRLETPSWPIAYQLKCQNRCAATRVSLCDRPLKSSCTVHAS